MLCPRLQTIIGPLQFITMIDFTFYKASSLLFLEREEMILEIRFICQCANSVSKIAFLYCFISLSHALLRVSEPPVK